MPTPSIVLAASSFLPRAGGVEEHVHHLAVELRDAGHRVAVWAVDRGDKPAAVPGVTVRYLPAPLPAARVASVRSFARSAPVALAAWQRAWRQDRPDLVHVHCFGPNGPWATALARLHRTPLVIGAHGETFMDEHDVLGTSRLQRRALRHALARADAVTACSAYAAADLTRFGLAPERVDVVPNGVDPLEPPGPVPAWLPRRYVLGLGRLVHVKGFDLLLRAFAAAGLDPDVRLVIAGEGRECVRLERLAGELGIADRLVLPGRLERLDVVTVMARAETVVVPSRVEAFGIVVLEGLRAGAPVIATARGGAREVVTDGVDGLIVDPLDVPALAAALKRASYDEALRSRLGERGRETAAAHSWGRTAAQVMAVYDRVLGGPADPPPSW